MTHQSHHHQGAAIDPMFQDVGKTTGLTVWRIENFQLQKVSREHYGYFFDGDAYLILSSNIDNQGVKKSKWNIHYWIGDQASIDESCTASIKAVELDDYLGGHAVQYREVQNNESELFLSYFNGHISYQQGGAKSGLKDISQARIERKLYIVKGKKKPRVLQVPVNLTSLNQSDVFILVEPPQSREEVSTFYLWYPHKSNNQERIHAQYYARKIRDHEFGGRGTFIICDDDWDTNEKFWSIMGGHASDVREAGRMTDEAYENIYSSNEINLYRVHDDRSGKPSTTLVSSAPLKQAMLDSKDCFLIDCKMMGIYCWIGKRCAKNEKIHCTQSAHDFIARNNYPRNTPIVTVMDGLELISFKSIFADWKDPM